MRYDDKKEVDSITTSTSVNMPTEHDEQVRELAEELKDLMSFSVMDEVYKNTARFILAREKKLREALEIISTKCSCSAKFSHSVQCIGVIAALALSTTGKEDVR